MKTQVTRMKPDSANMVTQAGPTVDNRRTVEVMCAECGWEERIRLPTAPWVIFKDHPCRLIVESVSAGL